MNVKKMMVSTLAAAMVVTTTAPAFAETGNMELEQKNPVSVQDVQRNKENTENVPENAGEMKRELVSGNFPKTAKEKAEDFEIAVLQKSKQHISVKIATKNPEVKNYEVKLLKEGKPNEFEHIETLKGDASKGTYAFTRLLNPGEEYTLRVYAYKGENGRTFGEQKITLDNSFYSKILTNTEGKKAVSDAINEHKSSVTVTVPMSFDLYNGVLYGKWRNYNYANFKYKGFEQHNFMYKGKKYKRVTYKMGYNLSAAKDKKLRKTYTSISKKAKGSSKAKAKYFTSYLAKRCSYKITNKPTTYEFLLTSKKGQCSHYADAFQILCNISGVSCERVDGTYKNVGHAWNIVKIGKKWYWHDAGWADYGKTVNKKWCFKGTSDKKFMKSRKLDSKFRTNAWKKAHPMGKKSLKY